MLESWVEQRRGSVLRQAAPGGDQVQTSPVNKNQVPLRSPGPSFQRRKATQSHRKKESVLGKTGRSQGVLDLWSKFRQHLHRRLMSRLLVISVHWVPNTEAAGVSPVSVLSCQSSSFDKAAYPRLLYGSLFIQIPSEPNSQLATTRSQWPLSLNIWVSGCN